MGILKLLGSFLVFLSSLGLALGVTLGAAYGFAVLTVVGPIFDTLRGIDSGSIAEVNFAAFFGMVYGGAFGACAGLVLGVADGLVLFAFTRARHYPRPANGYRRAAGRACAAAGAVIFLALGAPVVAILMIGLFGSLAMAIVFGGLAPALVAALAMWFSGWLVAGLYVRWTSGAWRGDRIPGAGEHREAD